MSTNKPNISAADAREILWRKGRLDWLLDKNQQELYKIYKETKEKIVVWNLARGSGKSYCLSVIAIEECLKNPKALVKYCCPKQKEAQQIIHPIFRDILETCPKELKPEYIKSEGAWKFPSGAQIQLSGLDNGRAESLRGGSSILAIVDEAASKSLKDLKYIIRSILVPAVTRKKEINGKIILASTPPVSPDHPYVYFLRRAEIAGALTTRTIYSNPRMTGEMINKLIEECGGADSTDFKREYLCEIITSTDDAVIPEFTKDLQEKIIMEWKKPPICDYYVSMDLGVKDLTFVIFAYYDFRAAKLIIEDEYIINGQKYNTITLADAIKEKEKRWFINEYTGEQSKPLKRISDSALTVIQDLYLNHQLIFSVTKKDDVDGAINNLRVKLAEEKIIINPRCVNLIRHLRDATWNKNKTSFDRSVENGHYDGVPAAYYLVRNVAWTHNPYPANFDTVYHDGYYQIKEESKNQYKSIADKMTGRDRLNNFKKSFK